MSKVLLSRRAVIAGASLAIMTSPNHAADDYFRGKTITMIVGFAPGGGVDLAGRAMARHLPRFLPGAPTVIVQNIPGASGLLAANHIAQRSAPDGLTIGVPGRSWHLEALVGHPGARFDPAAFSYIGSTGVVNSMAWVRSDVGVRDFDGLKNYQGTITAGALSPGTPTATVPALFAAIGLPIKVVTGYPSTSDMLLALERNEVMSVFTTADSFATRPHLISSKAVIPVLQTKPELEGVPLARDQLPSRFKPLFDLARSGDSLGLMLIAPSGLSADPLDLLRAAFLMMSADDAYQSDLSKVDSSRSAPLSGHEVSELIRALKVTTTPEVIRDFENLKAGSLKR